MQSFPLLVTNVFKFTSHIWTHQLVNAVNGPVVLVTKSLHTLEAVTITRNKINSIMLYKMNSNFTIQHKLPLNLKSKI